MDNEFKVSWIDTNPQNSSYKNEYFTKNKISKKISSQDIEDKYEQRLEKGDFDILGAILGAVEVKSKLEDILHDLPQVNTEILLENISHDFVSYCSNF